MVWIDLEMTGLDPERDRVLEIAALITEPDLTVVAESPEIVLHQPEEVLARMDAWNQSQHTKSGLLERVRSSTVTEAEAEARMLEFVREHCEPHVAPLAGNTVHHDRRFLCKYLPRFVAYLHYRIVDVSTLKDLAARWYPNAHAKCPPKPEVHRALEDIRASLDELRYYRRTLFRAADDEKCRS